MKKLFGASAKFVKSAKPVKATSYNHAKIEKKWQKYWDSKKLYRASDKTDKPKYYPLIEFPYPSGDGLHVGHPRPYIGMDLIARKRRMEGYNVLYPIGWDAFGLPTENYAIKTGQDPRVVTKKNTDTFRRQIQSLGVSFDWSREINTTDPKYYKWTQWIFLQLFKKGLAYKKKMLVNWCPKDMTGLANEEVIDGCCERCGTPVEKREKEQWMLAITKYAERLDRDLDGMDYLPQVVTQQRNWIGKSQGAELGFKIINSSTEIRVFTTRPDTLFGVTYIVLAPEHIFVAELLKQGSTLQNVVEVSDYLARSKTASMIERTDATKEKTGVRLKGIHATNPATGEKVEVWVADYVLADYGTGAVMAVPAHDERDWEFAKKYDLPIKEVVLPNIIDKRNPPMAGKKYVERKNVHAIVRNPKTDEYLALKWSKYDWTTFPMGGVEGTEDVVEAARREVREETGFTDLKLVRVLDGQVRAEYFAAHKDQNRISFTTAVVFDLMSMAQEEISTEERDAHHVIWLKDTHLTYDHMTHAEIANWKTKINAKNGAYTGEGIIINSGDFTGKKSSEVLRAITESVGGKWVTTFKLRDWVFSRQRYWGEPIPVVHCEKCGIVVLPEKALPLKLPKVKNYKPTENGESPLASLEKWVKTKCPQCKGPARRETDTMPNWAGSSWYYLRYTDTKNKKALAGKDKLDYWTPVDWYNGGMEHTTLHLLYSRFWHKFLFDIGVVPTSEPYLKRTSHGLILAQGGEKMSKSKGNVVNPDSIVATVGADSLRLYEMFMGPFDQAIAWNSNNIAGVRRFIERLWKLREKVIASEKGVGSVSDAATNRIIHKTIKKVSSDIEGMHFNTAVSALMIALNECEKFATISRSQYEMLLKLAAPFIPHVTEELWASLGNKKSIHISPWPAYDATLASETEVTIMVQINGKVRGSFTAAADTSQAELERQAKSIPDATKWLEGKEIKKVIVIANKLVNIVVA